MNISIDGTWPLAILRHGNPHAGGNYREIHTTWHPVNGFTRSDGAFTVPSTGTADGDTIGGTHVLAGSGWVFDSGDITLPDALKEPRAFCQKGRLSGTFSGTNLIVRIEITSGWGRFSVYVDGAYAATISCDAEDHGSSLPSQYRDVPVCFSLTDTTHLLDIYAINPSTGADGYVAIVGFKVFHQTVQDAEFFAWRHPHRETGSLALVTDAFSSPALPFNREVLYVRAPGVTSPLDMLAPVRFSNKYTPGTNPRSPIRNLKHTAPGIMVPPSGGAFAADTPFVISGAGAALDFSWAGESIAATQLSSLVLSYQYSDPAGTITEPSVVTRNYWPTSMPATAGAVARGEVYGTANWSQDFDGPGSVSRIYNGGAGQNMYTNGFAGLPSSSYGLTSPLTAFTITIMKDYGWGKAEIYVAGFDTGGTRVAKVKLGSSTNGTGGTLPGDAAFFYNSGDAVGGGFAATVVADTFLDVDTTTQVRDWHLWVKPQNAKAFVILSWSITYTGQSWTATSDNFPLTVIGRQVPARPPANPRIGPDGFVISDPVSPDQSDFTVPFDNGGVVATHVRSRFPTYCVFYGPGYTERLADYDMLVIEPSAVSRQQVAYWQSLGIKVIGYVSFGEEDAKRVDAYDLGSTVEGPTIGDGLGPGGYASYYNKLGNLAGEPSECQHDAQRIFGQKLCTQGRSEYHTGVGRCSKICSKDWRTGYVTWLAGGACLGGFNKTNRWVRDASVACSNNACPGYSPLNHRCPVFQESEIRWSQDFASHDTYPDQNGIWDSTFINPINGKWFERLRDFYLPPVMNTQQQYTEDLTFTMHTGVVDGLRMVSRVSHYPIDDNETLTVYATDLGRFLERFSEFSYDATTGVFSISLLTWGAGVTTLPDKTVRIVYTHKGLQCDGVFMDTVDTVDVYPSDTFKGAFVNTIRDLKALWPSKYFCSNRGFGVLDDIIPYCSFVMFETFVSDYDFVTGDYGLITDQGAIDYNNGIKEQLARLRRNHTFDVLALNYAPNGPEGDELRRIIQEKCYADGYMSWTSVISLQDPLPNTPFTLNISGRIRSNLWQLRRRNKA